RAQGFVMVHLERVSADQTGDEVPRVIEVLRQMLVEEGQVDHDLAQAEAAPTDRDDATLEGDGDVLAVQPVTAGHEALTVIAPGDAVELRRQAKVDCVRVESGSFCATAH